MSVRVIDAHAGLAVPAQVRVGHPVAGLGQLRGQEPVDLPVVADAMRQDDQRPLPGHLVGDPAAINIQKLCDLNLSISLCDLHQVKPRQRTPADLHESSLPQSAEVDGREPHRVGQR
jgi:hypothetical protein